MPNRGEEPQQEKTIHRWAARLHDPSAGVREQACTELARLAVATAGTRDRLVPQLLDHARDEPHSSVVLNGMLRTGQLYRIPLEDQAWLERFVLTYIALAKRSDHMCEGGYRELRRLVEAGLLPPNDPLAREVQNVAVEGESLIEDDTRLHVLAILDWYEDHT